MAIVLFSMSIGDMASLSFVFPLGSPIIPVAPPTCNVNKHLYKYSQACPCGHLY